MISVIVPVYNVEPYLRKCLDSILGQTYQDLEIFVIDDGSTDGSGAICDEYSEKDERIRVFHTENRGLSAARNLGLDNVSGDWIGFVDSDDWIESDMYEVLLRRGEATGADVVECGIFIEAKEKTIEKRNKPITISGQEAVRLLLQETISNAVWNKLWKHQCFDTIRFPEGRIFEEHATTYRIYLTIGSLCTAASAHYHYIRRTDSLSQKHNIQNLMDCWQSNKERKEVLWNLVDYEEKQNIIRLCAIAIARTWAYFDDCTNNERDMCYATVLEMKDFTCQYIPLFGLHNWSLALRLGIFFSHFMNDMSFRVAWLINHIFRKISGLG